MSKHRPTAIGAFNSHMMWSTRTRRVAGASARMMYWSLMAAVPAAGLVALATT